MPRMPGPMRGPYLDALTKYAPILFGLLFLFVAVALIRNWIDARDHPETQHSEPFDIRSLNARGAARLYTGRPRTREEGV